MSAEQLLEVLMGLEQQPENRRELAQAFSAALDKKRRWDEEGRMTKTRTMLSLMSGPGLAEELAAPRMAVCPLCGKEFERPI